MQYTNCIAPSTTRKPRNASMSLVRCGVSSTYLSHIVVAMSDAFCEDVLVLADLDLEDDEVVADDEGLETVVEEEVTEVVFPVDVDVDVAWVECVD